MSFLAVLVLAGIVLTVYWTVSSNFPEITLGGWVLVCAYALTVVAVPSAVTPFLRRTIDLDRYTLGRAWRITAFLWVTLTAIAGLLAWPAIGPYIEPFFIEERN